MHSSEDPFRNKLGIPTEAYKLAKDGGKIKTVDPAIQEILTLNTSIIQLANEYCGIKWQEFLEESDFSTKSKTFRKTTSDDKFATATVFGGNT